MLQRRSFAGKPALRLYWTGERRQDHIWGSKVVQQDPTSGSEQAAAPASNEGVTAEVPRVPRSLFITNDFPPRIGGAQSYYWGLIQTLDPTDVVIIAPNQPGGHDFDGTHPYTVHRYPLEQLRPTRGLLRLSLQLIEEHGLELVQFGHPLPTGLLGPSIVKRTGLPYIVFLGGAEVTVPAAMPIGSTLLRRVLGNAALLAAVSDFTASAASHEVHGKVPAVTLRPPLDGAFDLPLKPSKAEAKAELGIDGELVIIIGRLVPRKGQDRLIEALALLRDEYPRLHLAVIGSGRIEGRLRRMAASNGVDERVLMAGALDTEDLTIWLRAADIFACPCRTRWGGLEVEGFGIVFAEASLARLPVLAGRSGGAPESVKNGETGIIPAGDSSEEVADALHRLLSLSPEARVAMGDRAREFTLSRHAPEVVGRQYRELLARVVRV
jgi:phosphatidylinositol alpha-1,6-mannosyltransferase